MDSRNQTPADPFWAVVQERHPDLDLVVLPPAAPESPPPAVGPDAVADAREGLDALAARIADLLDIEQPPAAEVIPGAGPGLVQVRVQTVSSTPDGAAALDRVQAALGAEVARRTGPVDQLSARIGPHRLQATWARSTGVLVLRLESAPLNVGR